MTMLKTWILVASRDQVRIFVREGLGKLTLAWDVGNPFGRLKNQDIESDRHGASTDNRMRAQQSYSTEEEARTRLLKDFYRETLASIRRSFVAERVDRLVLAAEPRLLGIIRELLPDELRRALTEEIPKDLWHEQVIEIEARLGTPRINIKGP